jgi:bifunctional DNase/RNase
MRLWASISTTRPRFPFATFGFYGGLGMAKSRDLEGLIGIVEPRMKNLIEVSVDSIRIHMPTAQHLVILKEKEADRYLPIWIGSFEAQAIATKISGNPLGRPLTHDLMATAFSDLGISVKRIVVTRLADQVFYARLYVKQDGRDLDFDARPSDAIALAVRVECPIFVATEVMETAGIIPEADEDGGDKDKAETPVDEERLAVFRDFVNSLDLPELPDEPGAKDEPGAQDKPGGRPGRG